VTAVGIVGPGRAGAGLGLALVQSGYEVKIHGRTDRVIPAPLRLTVGPVPPWLDSVGTVLLAVPDDAIEGVAIELAASGRIGANHTVLHLSGVLGIEALAPLQRQGCALGSLHPLQSLSDPVSAPLRLVGAAAAVEGDDRAVRIAKELAAAIGLQPFDITSEFKALYHAAAVFASNYLVVVAATAHRLLRQVGLSDAQAGDALAPIIRGAVENIVANGPERALTGPVARGDRATIERHLDALPDEEAALYRALGRAALNMTELPNGIREAVERQLSGSE
jgi:predicted short-subunit dehydrogenase-like oxidoreductase (DUF2520 family)